MNAYELQTTNYKLQTTSGCDVVSTTPKSNIRSNSKPFKFINQSNQIQSENCTQQKKIPDTTIRPLFQFSDSDSTAPGSVKDLQSKGTVQLN